MTLGFRHHLQATPSDRIREELAKAVALLRTALQRVERPPNSSDSASLINFVLMTSSLHFVSALIVPVTLFAL